MLHEWDKFWERLIIYIFFHFYGDVYMKYKLVYILLQLSDLFLHGYVKMCATYAEIT
jgi:hypothetical protein